MHSSLSMSSSWWKHWSNKEFEYCSQKSEILCLPGARPNLASFVGGSIGRHRLSTQFHWRQKKDKKNVTVRQVPAFQCSKPGMASAPARLPSWNWRSRMLFVCKLDETLANFMQNSWIHFSKRHICSWVEWNVSSTKSKTWHGWNSDNWNGAKRFCRKSNCLCMQ